ncbi:GntR family transcriptional regulator [Roseibium aquae]|uniref:GntR family transcriptional regulator n=1 Tax=Roseibium aquae TaxID=1323746 RepID=A0A916TJ91_9HYPH|nr:GntR family transcriptional regulator [Roseibium aquae]GGB46573.1 GntR family transcriptional regulator [Roseibium aquae]
MSAHSALKALGPIKIKTIADTVFEELHQQILSLELPPGTKVSEIEVAKALGVSRQPVRDAFFRLSQLGFLLIRPQRATVITKISEKAVLQAKFVRIALETACWSAAMEVITGSQLEELEALLDEQKAAALASDQKLFHALDDDLHRQICCIAGHEYVWNLIREQKSHMDRVRFISLTTGAAERAYNEHVVLIDALRERDKVQLEAGLSGHLGRIGQVLAQIRAEKPQYFQEKSA